MIIREKNKKKQFSYYLKCQILPVVNISVEELWQAKTAIKALSSQFSSSFHWHSFQLLCKDMVMLFVCFAKILSVCT